MQANHEKLKMAIRKSILLRQEGKYQESLSYLLAIDFLFDESEPTYLRHYICSLGRAYRFLGRSQEAIDEYERALKVPIRDEEDHADVAAIESNIAEALLDLNRPDEAHAFLDCPEEYLREKQNDHWLGEILESRARAYLQQNETELAIKAAQESYDLLKHYFDTPALEQARETLRVALQSVVRVKV